MGTRLKTHVGRGLDPRGAPGPAGSAWEAAAGHGPAPQGKPHHLQWAAGPSGPPLQLRLGTFLPPAPPHIAWYLPRLKFQTTERTSHPYLIGFRCDFSPA